MRLGVWEMAERVGIGFTSSASLFFEQAGVEQFGECFSELSVIAVSKCGSKASRLETAFRS